MVSTGHLRSMDRHISNPALLGTMQRSDPSLRTPTTEFIELSPTHEVLRSINPVLNKPQCAACHGPTETQPVNGILYVDYDAAPIRHKASRTTLLLMGAGAIIVLLNLTGGWWFIRRYIINPVDRLSAASDALAQGDLESRAKPRGDDEIAQLGHTFNHMAEQLQQRIDESEQQRSFLQSLIDAIPDGVRVISPDYRVLITNQAYRQRLGLSDSDGVGDTCHGVSHQSDQPGPSTLITCPIQEIAAHAKPVQALHRHHDTAGKITDVEIYAAPLTTSVDGVPQTLVVESIRDLSQQIKCSHEQRLSELGKLATGVAHEIYNPLTSVRMALDGLRKGMAETDAVTRVTEYLELVEQEVDKCVQVTERLVRVGMTPSEQSQLVEVTRVV